MCWQQTQAIQHRSTEQACPPQSRHLRGRLCEAGLARHVQAGGQGEGKEPQWRGVGDVERHIRSDVVAAGVLPHLMRHAVDAINQQRLHRQE